MLRNIAIGLVLVLTTSCVEWFNPDIETQERILVVEGLFTNRQDHHLIKLSMSLDYNKPFRVIPVISAIVYITDNFGNRIDFLEEQPGYYYSSSDAFGVVGLQYQLHIETSDGDIYVSDSQLMEEPILIDSLDVKYEYKDNIYFDDLGNQIIEGVEGVGLYARVNSKNDLPPRVRLQPILLAQYILSTYSDDPDLFFCRIKKNIDESINLTVPQLGIDIGSSIYHNVGFVNKSFYIPTVDTVFFRSVERRMIILRHYTLNQDSYLFYKELKNQLDSEGTLFDPVVSQIIGNIRCVSDPSLKVLGFFEVSSYNSETFLLSTEPLRPSNLSITHIQSLDYLPDHEESWEMIPEGWIY